MRKTALITFALLAFPLLAQARWHRQSPPPPPPPTTLATSTHTWGVYTDGTDASQLAFEQATGYQASICAVFWGMGDGFPTQGGKYCPTLLVFLEPTNAGFTYSMVTSGSYDAALKAFAAGANSYGKPVIVVPFDEFNLGDAGDCAGAPWGVGCNGNTAATFIAAWQRAYGILKGPNTKVALDYNNVSIPAAPFSALYPGSGYVDYVGIDGFNFGGQSASAVFAAALAQLQTFGKPTYIFSFGTVSPQSTWLQQSAAYTSSVAGFVYFDAGDFTLSDGLAAFKQLLQ